MQHPGGIARPSGLLGDALRRQIVVEIRQVMSGLPRAGARISPGLVGRNLDQIAVGIAAIHRRNGPARRSADRTLENLDAVIVQMADHLVRRHGGDEAHIAGPGVRADAGGPCAKIGIDRAQIDLLAAKFQRGAMFAPKSSRSMPSTR